MLKGPSALRFGWQQKWYAGLHRVYTTIPTQHGNARSCAGDGTWCYPSPKAKESVDTTLSKNGSEDTRFKGHPIYPNSSQWSHIQHQMQTTARIWSLLLRLAMEQFWHNERWLLSQIMAWTRQSNLEKIKMPCIINLQLELCVLLCWSGKMIYGSGKPKGWITICRRIKFIVSILSAFGTVLNIHPSSSQSLVGFVG